MKKCLEKLWHFNIVHKTNNKLKFLYRKNSFLTPALRRLFCNALMQPHFDYACSPWYPDLTKKLKHTGQLSLSYISPTFWNKTPDTFIHTKNLNTFKHNLKKFFFLNLYLFSTIKNPHFHL